MFALLTLVLSFKKDGGFTLFPVLSTVSGYVGVGSMIAPSSCLDWEIAPISYADTHTSTYIFYHTQ